ncbi:diacylglycerol kinase [Kaarinaea lacus]
MGKPGNTGFGRLIRATGFSIRGFSAAFRNEAAFRQELGFFIIMAPLAFWIGKSGIEIAILLGCLFIVLITELLNSAIEAVVDRVGFEEHELSGRAKDIGSAAVFLSLANVIIVWGLIIFW